VKRRCVKRARKGSQAPLSSQEVSNVIISLVLYSLLSSAAWIG
jgi:hypothetical protein